MIPIRQSGLEVVGAYWYPYQADLARDLLEARGVRAWILDEHQVRMRWHFAVALGGVKVVVSPDDAERAREILAEDDSDSLEGIAEQDLPPAKCETCPVCGGAASSGNVQMVSATPFQWLQAVAFLLTFGVLVPRRRFRVERTCSECGREWVDLEKR